MLDLEQQIQDTLAIVPLDFLRIIVQYVSFKMPKCVQNAWMYGEI